MIKYSLKCDGDHSFDSWFDDAKAYEKLEKAGLLSCAVCGSQHVSRALMAPSVSPARAKKKAGPLSAPASPAEQAMAEFRKKVESETENVGKDFTRQARAMHAGDLPSKAIRGESTLQDTKKMLEDGLPILPLPLDKSKAN